MQEYRIVFENAAGDEVDSLDFRNLDKAREVFRALVLKDFARAALLDTDGYEMETKMRA